MDCGKITSGLVAGACGKLPIGGTGTRAVVINYADVASYTKDDTNPALITAITLASQTKGYLFETIDNSLEASSTFEAGTYVSAYTHSVTFRIFKDNITAKKWVNEAKDGRYVVIVERREAGDNHWEVYGIEGGLKMSENAYSTSITDNVVYAPVFSSDDTSKETNMPATFYSTDAATTTAAVLALCQSSSLSSSNG